MMNTAQCVYPAGDGCGESPLWSEEEQAVYWVDLPRFLIHRFDMPLQLSQSWLFEEPPVALSLTTRLDTLLVAFASKIALWSPTTHPQLQEIFRLPDYPRVRLNDGGCDPRGNFWVGSMRNNIKADGEIIAGGGQDGQLYRLTPAGEVTVFERNLGISNTLCWSPDGGTFYFGDTLANTIYAYDYDPHTARVSKRRSFFAGFNRGAPDGSAIDSDGYLWNCRFGGGCVVRIAPDGTLAEIIDMPVSHITNATFGGRHRQNLILTTAQIGTPRWERLAGSLWSLPVTARGLADHRFIVD